MAMRRGGVLLPFLLAFALLAVAAGAPLASATAFRPEVAVLLPSGLISAFGIDVAAAGREVRVVYSGQLGSLGGFNWAISFSHDGGASFPGASFQSSADLPAPVSPKVVALSTGEFAYLWVDANGFLQIELEQPDGGWRGPEVLLAGTPVSPDFDAQPLGPDLVVAWSERPPGPGILQVGLLSGSTFHFASRQTIDPDAATAKLAPRIRVHGDEIFAVWLRAAADWRPFFSHGGFASAWPAPVPVTAGPAAVGGGPDLAVRADGTALIAFAGQSGTAFPLTGGWSVPPYGAVELFDLGSRVGALLPSGPAVDVDAAGRLLLAWLDGDPATRVGGFRVMSAESEDGSNFTAPVRLDGDPAQFGKDGPRLKVQGTAVLVAWGDRRDGQGTPKPYLVAGATTTGPPAALLLALGLEVALVVIAVLVVLRRRRRKERPSGASAASPPGPQDPSPPP